MQLSIKHRPAKFSEVFGQEVTKKILVNSIRMSRQPQALLLTGIRGIGKTTIARIYSAALNCVNFVTEQDACGSCPSCIDVQHGTNSSVLELDAASNSGVENIRDLEEVVTKVSEHQRRVIIIDEAHMLSKAAQAALLKIIEDPKNTIFILVTTDPQRLEPTVRSRCMNLPLKALSDFEIAQAIRTVCAAESAQVSEEFVQLLSRLGGGSLRDVLQILDRMLIAAGEGPLDGSLLRESAGITSTAEYGELADVLDQRDLKFFMEEIARWYAEGRDLYHMFMDGVPVLLRDFSIFLCGVRDEKIPLMTGLPYESLSCNLKLQLDDVRRINREWESMVDLIRMTNRPKLIWEVFAVKVCVGG